MSSKITFLIILVLVSQTAADNVIASVVDTVLCLLTGCPSTPDSTSSPTQNVSNAESAPTDCDIDPANDLVVYDVCDRRVLENPTVSYDFATSKFVIKEDGADPNRPMVAVINKSLKTVFFVDYEAGYIDNPRVDANGKAIGYNVMNHNFNLPLDALGVLNVTTLGEIIPDA